MPYGTIKVDQVIYTKGGSDTTITVSGIVDSLSGAISVTGAISGASVSAATGTFTTLSGNTTAGTTATFTSGVFTTFSGTTVNVVSGVFASGTVALPSVSVGTSGNGLYSPGANQLAISTSGTGRLTVDNSGNVNIDSGTFYVDAVNNYVGVGTTGPGTKVHAVGGNVWSSNFYEVGRFQKTSGTGVSIGYDNSAYVASIGAYSHDGTASSLSFWTYPGSGSALERLRLDSSGNLGLGVVPSAWRSGAKAFQLGGTGYASLNEQANGSTSLNFNCYESAANTWTYLVTGVAPSRYTQLSGAHSWLTAPSGTAGNAITFTQAMTLTAGGYLGIGATSPGSPLTVESSAGNQFKITYPSIASYYLNVTSAGALDINKDGSSRLFIDSSGRLLVGTASTTANGDAVIQANQTQVIGKTATAVANNGTTTATLTTGGAAYQGFLVVSVCSSANATISTSTTYSIFGRGTTSTITQIATANGGGGARSFTVTTPTSGIITVTNTAGSNSDIFISYFGGLGG